MYRVDSIYPLTTGVLDPSINSVLVYTGKYFSLKCFEVLALLYLLDDTILSGFSNKIMLVPENTNLSFLAVQVVQGSLCLLVVQVIRADHYFLGYHCCQVDL